LRLNRLIFVKNYHFDVKTGSGRFEISESFKTQGVIAALEHPGAEQPVAGLDQVIKTSFGSVRPLLTFNLSHFTKTRSEQT
jgi:hypothetical protein